MRPEETIDGEVCGTCKSFSAWGKYSRGYCLRKRKPISSTNTCGYYRPDIQVSYAIECKKSDKSSRLSSFLPNN